LGQEQEGREQQAGKGRHPGGSLGRTAVPLPQGRDGEGDETRHHKQVEHEDEAVGKGHKRLLVLTPLYMETALGLGG
jgi:hypothetical protein